MSTQTGAKAKNGKFKTYFKGVKAEMKKVVWPTRKELVNYTAVVIAVSVITSLLVALLDFGIRNILSLFIK